MLLNGLNRERIAEELSMLVGIVSDDITYLYYLFVKDNPVWKDNEQTFQIGNENTVDTLEEWFAKLEEL